MTISTSFSEAPPHLAQRPPGEGLNLLTHALGFVLSLVGADRLLRAVWVTGDPLLTAGCTAYAVTLLAVYGASTLSHAFWRPGLRHFFRTVDQMCIFLLIAGSYTPWGIAYYRDGWGLVLLIAFWSLALMGAFFKLFVRGLHNVSTTFYVLLGWLPVLAIQPILQRVPPAALAWVVGGGMLYTLGTWFLHRDERRPYFHAVWHMLVIAASTVHFIGVMIYVVPHTPGG